MWKLNIQPNYNIIMTGKLNFKSGRKNYYQIRFIFNFVSRIIIYSVSYLLIDFASNKIEIRDQQTSAIIKGNLVFFIFDDWATEKYI